MQNKLLFFGMIFILVGLTVVHFSLQPEVGTSQTGDSDYIYSDDPAMQAAYDKAREQLDYFLKTARSKPEGTQGFSVRIGVQEDGITEFFWIFPFEQYEGEFAGRVSSDPKQVSSVFKGEVIRFSRGQIIDWTFDDKKTNVMHGNYTGCVELQQAAPEYAAQFMELYGLDCTKLN